MQALTIQQHLFNQIEYPLKYQRGVLLKTVSVLFVLIFLFLLLFRPFGVYTPEHKVNYVFICLLHALNPALIIFAYFFLVSYVYEHTSSFKGWTLLQEYAHLAIIFFLTGIGSFLLRSLIYNNPDNWSWHYLGEEMGNCYLVGILFYFLLLFAGAYFRTEKPFVTTDVPVENSTTFKETRPEVTTDLFIKTQVQQDDFSFDPASLLFAKADGNYIQFTLCKNNQAFTELKRITLKQFEAQVIHLPFLIRCHRAYLVNLKQIKQVSGNAQGYTLSMNMTDELVLVSRSQLETFNSRYQQLSSTILT